MDCSLHRPVAVRLRVASGAHRLVLYCAAVAAAGAGSRALAGDHPRLLIQREDVARLRHVCGVGAAGETRRGWGKFGGAAEDFQFLRAHFNGYLGEEPLPGELLAAAFLHVIDPEEAKDVNRLGLLNGVLQRSAPGTDPLELVLALDWCYDALEPAARREALLTLRERAGPLVPADSPLEPRRFREKLAALALALAVDADDDASPSWLELRERLLAAARTYFTQTFPAFLAWRTATPTSSAAAPREECDTVFALELAAQLGGADTWTEHAGSVGRWLEHYLYEDLGQPALAHGFVRGPGDAAPLTPAPDWDDLLPITAHLLAVRTRDPAAAALADRVAAEQRRSGASPTAGLWRWVPLVLDTSGIPRCDTARLPPARNFGGAVVFRSAAPDATAIWVNAGQTHLERRQAFDAGSFQIHRGGTLAVTGAADVLLEAITSKRGEQRLGSAAGEFDFDQYCTASIAHNCLVQWDSARAATWNGKRYLPIGGQRCIDGTCTDFTGTPAEQGRETGRQLAYGQRDGAAYLALNLAPAYDDRYVTAYTREFVFFGRGALVVIDRVALARRGVPTWVLNVPARPSVEGADLTDAARVAGSTNDAGIWRYDSAGWLRWTDRAGGLWCRPLLPAARTLRIVGGPARQDVTPHGRFAGRSYCGGAAESFERLINPGERHNAHNAWFRLGEPTLLGPQFGKRPHWGRIEIEPAEPAPTTTFVTLLIADAADAEQTPAAAIEERDDALHIRIAAGELHALLRVPARAPGGGTLELRGPDAFTWTLPVTLNGDAPLPTR